MTIIGIQHKKSVKTISIILLAIFDSLFMFVDLTCFATPLTLKYIAVYAVRMYIKETKFRMIKMLTAYSQPACLSVDS